MRVVFVLATCCLLVSCHPATRVRRADKQQVDAQAALTFFSTFGYVKPGSSGGKEDGKTLEETLSDAIKKYQANMGLKVTGELDVATKNKIVQPRCGIPNVAREVSQDSETLWEGQALRYYIEDEIEDMTKDEFRRGIAEAFGEWSRVTPLEFTEVNNAEGADFKIGFRRGDHGGEGEGKFDGKGTVLAHAFYPRDGRVHFDEDEDWVVDDPEKLQNGGQYLMSTAIHEIGHALGLDHSYGDEASIMYPYVQNPEFNEDGSLIPTRLRQEDIERIQALYGVREENGGNKDGGDDDGNGDNGDGSDDGEKHCSEGFTHFEKTNKCYKILSGHGSVDAANKACGELHEGYTLSSVRNQQENNFITGLNEEGATYLGLLSKKEDNVNFEWLDGSDSDYTNWLPDEPTTQYGAEYCVVVYGKAFGKELFRGWNNAPCDLDYQYVCASPPLS